MPGKQEEPVSALESFKHLFKRPRVMNAVEISKPIRVKSKRNLREAKEQPCEICGALPGDPNNPVDPHHITTRGAGGGDEKNNVLSACRKCHKEIHAGKTSKAKQRELVKARK